MSQPTPPEGISVNLIVRNCAQKLRSCLESVVPFLRTPDEIVVVDTGSTDNGATIAVAKEFDCRVLEHPELSSPGMLDLIKKYLPSHFPTIEKDPAYDNGFLSDFAKARQIAADASKNDLIFWLDSDDILTGGAPLRQLAADLLSKDPAAVIFLAYDYSFEEDGACNTVLWRERIIRRSRFAWAGVCHESMIPRPGTPPVNAIKADPSVSKLIHKHGRHHIYSDIRNYAILRHAYETASWKDPRWEFYLGNASRGLNQTQESIRWYCKTLSHSGSPEDRLSAALCVSYAHIMLGRPWKAIDWFFQAIKIMPNEPRAYFGIARSYFDLKRYQDTLRWTQMGYAQGRPNLLTSVDPNHYDFYPKVFEALALKELGMLDAALRCAKEAKALRPNYSAAESLVRDLFSWAQAEQIKAAVSATCQLAFSHEAATDIIHRLKPEVRKVIPDLQLEVTATPPKKSITFLCGAAPEPWDHTSLESGIGGSEKMVILLAHELAYRGYTVDVYNNPKPENAYRSFDGVTYLPVQAFNPKFPRDTVIIWRHWGLLDLPLRANRLFMDLHDVQDPSALTDKRLARLTAAIFKSNFHLAPVRDRIGSKGIVLRNAILPTHFPQANLPARDYGKIVFCSSGDRGLKRALRIFGRLKQIDPTFSFHFFYGFTPFYLQRAASVDYSFMGDEGCERHMLDYAEECFSLADALGAVSRGRIGHAALASELQSSSILLYPTKFPEISCMAAMEAQAAGCLPVASNFGALSETVKYGTLCNPDDDAAFINACLAIKSAGPDRDAYRREATATALRDFDIKTLGDAWVDLLTRP